MEKNVLYISYDGMTDPLGQSQVIPYLKGLVDLGHHIYLVSAEKKERFEKNGEDLWKQLNAFNIHWHPVMYSNMIPGISAYLTYRRLRNKSMQLSIQQPIDIVHCRSYIPAIIGLEIKNRFSCKLIFDMRGFWADERVEGGIWHLKNPLYKRAFDFFKKKEYELLQHSDAIISLTENAKQEMLGRNELSIIPEKITVIPCCADLDFFSEKNAAPDRTAFRKELGIQSKDFVLCYSGSTGTWYLLNEMLRFFSCLHEAHPDSIFLLVTMDAPEIILAEAKKLRLPAKKIIIRSVARKLMPQYLSIADAAIFFIRNSFSKKASSPTKMGEFMSMGIPIICNSGVGDVDVIMKQCNAGIVLSSLDNATMKAAAIQLLQSSFSKEKIIAAAQSLSLEKGIGQYQQVYLSL
ncbi:MAG: glycosyltransferase [Chitinophagales bacterium]